MGRVSKIQRKVCTNANLWRRFRIKESGVQWDERIVECNWDADYDSWRFMRFRDDKLDGNHWSIVQKIIESIRDGVELETVCLLASSIFAQLIILWTCVTADRTVSDHTCKEKRASSSRTA